MCAYVCLRDKKRDTHTERKTHTHTHVHARSLELCLTLWDLIDCSLPDSSVHGDSPGKNTGVGCHALLQGIFPTHTETENLLDH